MSTTIKLQMQPYCLDPAGLVNVSFPHAPNSIPNHKQECHQQPQPNSLFNEESFPCTTDHSTHSNAKPANINKQKMSSGCSFLETITNNTGSTPSDQTPNTSATGEGLYVHPLVKRSESTLSVKSLEMCTESLGSESGSDTASDDLFNNFNIISTDQVSSRVREMGGFVVKRSNRGNGREGIFPPPLASISGINGGFIKLKTYREDGRLLMSAVNVESVKACFQAEREGGRLRLRFADHHHHHHISRFSDEEYSDCDKYEEECGQAEEKNDSNYCYGEEAVKEEGGDGDEIEGEINHGDECNTDEENLIWEDDDGNNRSEECNNEHNHKEDESAGRLEEKGTGTQGITSKTEGKIRISTGKLMNPCRCKEGESSSCSSSRSQFHWEPYWVATS